MKVKFIGVGDEVEVLGIGLFKRGEVRELSDDFGYNLINGNANFVEVKEIRKPEKEEVVSFTSFYLKNKKEVD